MNDAKRTPAVSDPWSILGLAPDATSEQIGSRYSELIKRHPPDRDPEGFQRVRDAYQSVSDVRRRAWHRLFGPKALGSLDDLRALLPFGRVAAGIDLWLAAAKELKRP